jgi:hypothetical protein
MKGWGFFEATRRRDEQLLVEQQQAEALRRGYGEIRFHTHQMMVENQRLYASIGYEATGRAPSRRQSVTAEPQRRRRWDSNSLPLASVSLDSRRGEGTGGRSGWSRKTPSLFTGGTGGSNPFAPAVSHANPIDATDLDSVAASGRYRA